MFNLLILMIFFFSSAIPQTYSYSEYYGYGAGYGAPSDYHHPRGDIDLDWESEFKPQIEPHHNSKSSNSDDYYYGDDDGDDDEPRSMSNRNSGPPNDDSKAENTLCSTELMESDVLMSGQMSNNIMFATKKFINLWKGGIIPYKIAPALYSKRRLIRKAMRHIERRTCIRFKPKRSDKDYVNIIQGSGCYSYVGRLGGGSKQPLSLGVGCHHKGTIVHELIHAVGFHHEHSRSDRDDYLYIRWDHVNPRAYGQFKKIDPKNYPQILKFDYQSVMLYGSTAFSKDRVSPTILPRDPGIAYLPAVHRKPGMSPVDAKRIRILYKCHMWRRR